jgi:Tol biopolymer transport system component
MGSGTDSDIWIYDISRKSFSRFTFGGGHSTPIWSPDGNTIYYSSRKGAAHWGVWRKPSDSSGEAELLTEMPGDFRILLDCITSDGKTLYASLTTEHNGSDVDRLAVAKGAKPEPVVTTPFDDFSSEVSPNGEWLAYESLETGRPEIYVRGTKAGGRWQISNAGGEEPRWSRDGRELYFRNNNQLMFAPVELRPTFQAGTPQVLFEGVYNLRSDSGVSFSVAPDGRFLMIRHAVQQNSSRDLHVVLNFTEEVTKATAGQK